MEQLQDPGDILGVAGGIHQYSSCSSGRNGEQMLHTASMRVSVPLLTLGGPCGLFGLPLALVGLLGSCGSSGLSLLTIIRLQCYNCLTVCAARPDLVRSTNWQCFFLILRVKKHVRLWVPSVASVSDTQVLGGTIQDKQSQERAACHTSLRLSPRQFQGI